MAMGASMSNTGFIGTAVLTMLIGSHAAIYISLTLILENLLILALVLALAEAGMQEKQAIFPLVIKTAKAYSKPSHYCNYFGNELYFARFETSGTSESIIELLGKTASPLALFAIGGSLVGMGIKALNLQSALLVGMKVLLMPLLILACLVFCLMSVKKCCMPEPFWPLCPCRSPLAYSGKPTDSMNARSRRLCSVQLLAL